MIIEFLESTNSFYLIKIVTSYLEIQLIIKKVLIFII